MKMLQRKLWQNRWKSRHNCTQFRNIHGTKPKHANKGIAQTANSSATLHSREVLHDLNITKTGQHSLQHCHEANKHTAQELRLTSNVESAILHHSGTAEPILEETERLSLNDLSTLQRQ